MKFARETSGVAIYGDAYTWWDKAKGRYERGRIPQVGAILAIRPYGNSLLGHVATVSRVVDPRTILISHANWSTPGAIERNVVALDVSPHNDWSEVRIWHGPSQNLGRSHWPVSGFIYPGKAPRQKPTISSDIMPARVTMRESTAIRPANQLVPARHATQAASTARSPTRFKNDPIGAIIAGNF